MCVSVELRDIIIHLVNLFSAHTHKMHICATPSCFSNITAYEASSLAVMYAVTPMCKELRDDTYTSFIYNYSQSH